MIVSTLRRSNRAGALGCATAIEENGYPLGSDSSMSIFTRRTLGRLPLLLDCWRSVRCGRTVGCGRASPSYRIFWTAFAPPLGVARPLWIAWLV